MNRYRIILADDHAMIREGIRELIQTKENLCVVGEACEGLELIKLLKKKDADMVILDIAMPRLRGIEAADSIRKDFPHIAILFLSMHKNPEFLSMAIKSGAKGYLLKEDSGRELFDAVSAIRSGKTFISKKLLMEYPKDIISICKGEMQNGMASLTKREREVLKLIAEGNTDRRIGEILFISHRTVNRHHYNIRQKLGMKTTAELIKFAMKTGII